MKHKTRKYVNIFIRTRNEFSLATSNSGDSNASNSGDLDASNSGDSDASTSDDWNTSFTDESDVQVIGNDSFEYNERAKYGGTYMTKNDKSNKDIQLSIMSVVEYRQILIFDSIEEIMILPEKINVLNSPQESDLSIAFFSEAGMLTSTLLEGNKSLENKPFQIEKIEVASDVNSQIFKIEAMISAFVKNAEQEMQLLKQLVAKSPTSGVVKDATLCSNVVKSLESMLRFFFSFFSFIVYKITKCFILGYIKVYFGCSN